MPTAEHILQGIREIANNWRLLAIFWHAYFGALAAALVLGVRPSKRLAGILLALPLFSVSAAAWAASNPFNGVIYLIIGILFVYFSSRLTTGRVQIAPLWMFIPGLIMFLFGWVYPHFLNTATFVPYLYSAPTGLIPCPTLSILSGLFLILSALGSRALALTLGISGLLYALIGVFRLGVTLDAVMFLGAVVTLVTAFSRKDPGK